MSRKLLVSSMLTLAYLYQPAVHASALANELRARMATTAEEAADKALLAPAGSFVEAQSGYVGYVGGFDTEAERWCVSKKHKVTPIDAGFDIVEDADEQQAKEEFNAYTALYNRRVRSILIAKGQYLCGNP
ncbi:hypothetical protein [Pokkaliibacter plantistimulans]|nr:hypothetical protein [Pokkaliibacter plantistimulans]